jgi:hypothetical protein
MLTRNFKKTLIAFSLMLSGSAGAAVTSGNIIFEIGEPAGNSVNSGIGVIRGWAVCDACTIKTVEGFIDGSSIGLIPYGGDRGDVANVYPDIADSIHSGWATAWPYSFYDPAVDHEIKITVCDTDAQCTSKSKSFRVERFSPEFIGNADAFQFEKAKVIGRAKDKMTITGITHVDPLTGETFNTVVTLKWDIAHQSMTVSHVDFALKISVTPTRSLNDYDINGNGFPNYDNDGDGKIDAGITLNSYPGIDIDVDKNGFVDFDNDNNTLVDLDYFVPNLANPLAYDIDGDGCPDYDDDCNDAVDFDSNGNKIYDFSGTPINVDIDSNGFPNFDNNGDGIVDVGFRVSQ